ncbi:exported hypothetical protein [Candidatus Desulfarcum epimagneticum]|uniref:Cytochrome C n=1 Tax=uncultured Desulfobacteraceae bacterium TaxID=218296 RepID=A0A484HNN6_9BACT|nr:exported hypothetical protein [uncultured Desulfobacteraceae bacterium]
MRFAKARGLSWALALAVCLAPAAPALSAVSENDSAPGRKMARQAVGEKKSWITADHSQHDILKQKFTSGPEVTRACLHCHNQAAVQFHKTIHWTWMNPLAPKEAGLGKGGLSINNF